MKKTLLLFSLAIFLLLQFIPQLQASSAMEKHVMNGQVMSHDMIQEKPDQNNSKANNIELPCHKTLGCMSLTDLGDSNFGIIKNDPLPNIPYSKSFLAILSLLIALMACQKMAEKIPLKLRIHHLQAVKATVFRE